MCRLNSYINPGAFQTFGWLAGRPAIRVTRGDPPGRGVQNPPHLKHWGRRLCRQRVLLCLPVCANFLSRSCPIVPLNAVVCFCGQGAYKGAKPEVPHTLPNTTRPNPHNMIYKRMIWFFVGQTSGTNSRLANKHFLRAVIASKFCAAARVVSWQKVVCFAIWRPPWGGGSKLKKSVSFEKCPLKHVPANVSFSANDCIYKSITFPGAKKGRETFRVPFLKLKPSWNNAKLSLNKKRKLIIK